MNTQDAKQVVKNIDNLRVVTVDTDADTVILQIKDADRGPRNFHPDSLAKLLSHDAVFDAWVENDKFFVQMN